MTGSATGPPAQEEFGMQLRVSENTDRNRFEVYVDGELAGFVTYSLRDGQISFPHTETFPRFQHRGVASALVREALNAARDRGLSVLPLCGFVSWFIDRNREYVDLVPADQRARFGLDALRG
jgi:predicted GNAT family acetyltransferase